METEPRLMSHFERCTPEQAGISSEGLLAVVRELDACDQVHSLLIVRHGRVLYEGYWAPYGAEQPHQLFSVSKSFTSTAIGFCVQEGLLDIDAPLCRYFQAEMPAEVTERLARMTARHLLTMSSGHGECIAWRLIAQHERDWVRAFFAHPLVSEPGSTFVYNSLATYVLSELVTRLTGEKLVDYLTPRLFAPLGIAKPEWDEAPNGSNTGGWGLHLCTEALAKLGQLYLQGGVWQGKRLLAESWIEQASSAQIDNSPGRVLDWAQGYGFQFWRCLPEGAYRADGAYGQYCVVVPKLGLVVAMTEATADMQRTLSVLWEKLLPLCGDKPLPENREAQERLWEMTAKLTVRHPVGAMFCPDRESDIQVDLEDNARGFARLALSFEPDGCVLCMYGQDGSERRFAFGRGQWRYSRHSWDPEHDGERSAGIMAWQDHGDLLLSSCELSGPFRFDLTLHFSAPGQLNSVSFAKNYHFWGSGKWPDLLVKA